MDLESEKLWQEILTQRFPGVIVRRNHNLPTDGDDAYYNVFLLPDDKHAAFTEFYIEELSQIAEKRGLEVPFLLPVDVSDTLRLYPNVAAALQPLA
jgi:hypothetical protein